MCLSNVQGYGNCCFSAVAFGRSANWGSFTDEEKTALISRGLLASMNEETMAAKLRKLAVEEWLVNSSSFFTHVEEEAMLPGYFMVTWLTQWHCL